MLSCLPLDISLERNSSISWQSPHPPPLSAARWVWSHQAELYIASWPLFYVHTCMHALSLSHVRKTFINPRHACARVTVLGLSVCVYVCVCVSYSGTSHNQAYKQQYQRLQRDTGMKYKKGFFLKTLRSEVMASFAYRDSPRRHSSALELAFSTTEYFNVVKKANGGLRATWNTAHIRQKARVLWQSLSLLSQCSEHVTIPHNFRICVHALCARARMVSRVNGMDIRTSCSPHPLIVVITCIYDIRTII